MTTTNPLESNPDLVGTLKAMQTLADGAGISLDEAVEILRTGAIDPGRTVTEAIDRAMNQATAGIREALDPYVKVLKFGMPGVCTCTCDACLEVVERHRKVPGGDGEREPVPCPCVEAGTCDCASSKHLEGSSCLDGCPVLGPIPVQDLDDEPDVVRNWVRARAKRRQLARNLRRAKNGRAQKRASGDHAVEQYNDTLRRTYAHAGLRLEARVERIDAIPGTRRPKKDEGRGITTEQFSELCRVAWTGGDDPDLDGLLVVFEVCTGARREGILELRTDSLDFAGMKLALWEKAGSTRWQPVERRLLAMVVEHVIDRHFAVLDPARWERVTADQVLDGKICLPSGIPIFHYRPKRKDGALVPHPVTRRRFNTLYGRIQETLPWADKHGVHGHDMRRTGASWIEGRFGRGVAAAWLGHADDVTGGYTRGTPQQVQAAANWLCTLVFGDRG